MLRKSIIVAAIALLVGSMHLGAKEINIVPMPQSVEMGVGAFNLTAQTKVYAQGEGAAEVVRMFSEKIRTSSGLDLLQGKKAGKGTIAFVIDSKVTGKEAYVLSVKKDVILCKASTPAGLFYGMQSLLQLLPPEVEGTALNGKITGWTVPVCEIVDAPRFAYRGVHLDPCRHFQDVETVKRQIDLMASYKINHMHWHLTEDQGWRIEIKKYPKLTSVGARRVEGDGSIHQGFYTQDEIREVVEYARQRHVAVVPELEIPGHELAAIAAYPELSCTEEPITPRIIWGVEDIVMCPGKEKMFEFMQDVIDEMVELFPYELFHIGGDESPRGEWEKCPKCQQRIKELGYKDEPKRPKEAQLQSYVVGRIGEYLAKKGRRIIGWDEILEGGNLDTTAIVMSWRGEEGGIVAAKAGHPVLMTPSSHGFYFDHYQADPFTEPTAIGGFAPIEKVYDYDPVPAELRGTGKENLVMGVQANSWSEYILNPSILETRLYPRVLALAEVAWTQPEHKSYADFSRRLDGDAALRLHTRGVNFFIPQPEQPGGSCDKLAFTENMSLTLTAPRGLTILYTLDGTTPCMHSPRYVAPLKLTSSATIKTATLLPCGLMSPVRTIQARKMHYMPAVAQMEDVKPGLVQSISWGTFQQPADVPTLCDETGVIIDKIETLRTLTHVPNSIRNVKHYAATAEGYVNIPEDGVYEFTSNNHRVWIDGQLLIDNSSLLIPKLTKTNEQVALSKGLHKVKVLFMGGIWNGWPTYWDDAALKMRRGNGDWQTIGSEMLFH